MKANFWKNQSSFDFVVKRKTLPSGTIPARKEPSDSEVNHFRLHRAFMGITLILSTASFSTVNLAYEPNEKVLSTPAELTVITETIEQKQNPWLFLHPYNANYTVLSDGDKLGKATRVLSKKNTLWTLATSAKVSKFILTIKSNESTQFRIDENDLVNEQFISSTKMSFKKTKRMKQVFDWVKGIETGNRDKKKWTLALKYPVYDRVSHLIQLRADLLLGKKAYEYPVSYKGKLWDYSYREEKREKLKTKMGEFETIKFVREKSNDDKFIVWLSPELNYFPVKIAQLEEGKPDITLLLNELNYLKNPVIIGDKTSQ